MVKYDLLDMFQCLIIVDDFEIGQHSGIINHYSCIFAFIIRCARKACYESTLRALLSVLACAISCETCDCAGDSARVEPPTLFNTEWYGASKPQTACIKEESAKPLHLFIQ